MYEFNQKVSQAHSPQALYHSSTLVGAITLNLGIRNLNTDHWGKSSGIDFGGSMHAPSTAPNSTHPSLVIEGGSRHFDYAYRYTIFGSLPNPTMRDANIFAFWKAMPRMSWSPRNLYNLWRRSCGAEAEAIDFTRSPKTLFQQRWISKALARRLVVHGSVLLNGKKHTNADTRLAPGDVVSVDPAAIHFLQDPESTLSSLTPFNLPPYASPFGFIPAYAEVSFSTCSAIYVRHPTAHPGYSEIPTPSTPMVKSFSLHGNGTQRCVQGQGVRNKW
ncbi:hypothetical protein DFJ58DRAFT_836885 [Suillus subalutaceus]|uniref:uncharacterized protein n=1 Tax=Suillus subalutaceus TaxID=48586 RepID=UPI001B873C35|nr:uncharacterized protein DFJ58DRAFT_836885 [Suillus subalutaceus]KAG1872311.1 hypothetical protein DFJ58DRAFT_836885 [Suillus subalutaceus]